MKPEHKAELKRILDTYDDKIKDAEAYVKAYEEKAIELIRAKREEMLTLINDMATWKMGQLFSDNGKLWQVTDIRSCTTSVYYDLEVAYTVTAVNSIGKTLSEMYQVNLSDEDIARDKWQPINNAKDVYVIPSKIVVKEIRVIKENKYDSLYLIKDVRGKCYTFECDMSTLTCFLDQGLIIKRRASGHATTIGKYHVFIKYYKSGKFRCHFEVKNLQLVTKDNKELIGLLVEELV
jgi:hypothetical protein